MDDLLCLEYPLHLLGVMTRFMRETEAGTAIKRLCELESKLKFLSNKTAGKYLAVNRGISTKILFFFLIFLSPPRIAK
jgi:hypothetical protein